MLYRCRELARQHPNAALSIAGFCVMAAPAIVGGVGLLWIWLSESVVLPLFVNTTIVAGLRAFSSVPGQSSAWLTFFVGFAAMMTGVVRAWKRGW